MQIPFWHVPRLWPGGTVVCLGGGPSLTAGDASFAVWNCDGAIGISDAYRLNVPLDMIYSADYRWWKMHHQDVVVSHPEAIHITVTPEAAEEFSSVRLLGYVPEAGWSEQQDRLNGGGHSGHQAINLAMLTGASRIILLGYDFKADGEKENWFGKHWCDVRHSYKHWIRLAEGMNALAQARGVNIINCSRDTALTEYPRANLEDAL